MGNIKPSRTRADQPKIGIEPWGIKLILGILGVTVVTVVLLIASSPLGQAIGTVLDNLFALNSVQTMWYITRASGLVAYLLLWLSTAWGLAVSSKILDQLLHRTFTYDFHQYISLFAIGFTFLHILVLLFDGFMPYSVPQILLPFISPYRPLWVGIGVIGLYIMLLVTVTFYMRSRIGMGTFRVIHFLSLLGYLGAAVHSVFSGSDSSLVSVQLLYIITFLIVVFLTAHWLIMMALKKVLSPRRT
jgi:predicted ferric reductase